ncbi:MAG: hypothetical protein OXH99_18410, partial [Bryobacterales bacterium]|nr:hypothetical protein [Bryobacterales bacterium]
RQKRPPVSSASTKVANLGRDVRGEHSVISRSGTETVDRPSNSGQPGMGSNLRGAITAQVVLESLQDPQDVTFGTAKTCAQ